MANSSFGALALIMLVVAFAVLLLTPHERHNSGLLSNPQQLWSSER